MALKVTKSSDNHGGSYDFKCSSKDIFLDAVYIYTALLVRTYAQERRRTIYASGTPCIPRDFLCVRVPWILFERGRHATLRNLVETHVDENRDIPAISWRSAYF